MLGSVLSCLSTQLETRPASIRLLISALPCNTNIRDFNLHMELFPGWDLTPSVQEQEVSVLTQTTDNNIQDIPQSRQAS